MKLAQIIQDHAEQGDDVDFREDYSGRCMYDKTCVGVVTPDLSTFLSFFAYLARQVSEGDLDRLTNIRQDSMGRGTIYYWPSINMETEAEATEMEEQNA